jgi:hypothetical protein
MSRKGTPVDPRYFIRHYRRVNAGLSQEPYAKKDANGVQVQLQSKPAGPYERSIGSPALVPTPLLAAAAGGLG